MKGRAILSLCDYSGAWPRPYAEAGYLVIQVDPKLSGVCFACGAPFDVEALGRYGCPNCLGEGEGLKITRIALTVQAVYKNIDALPPIHGLLMAPPCTDFTVSGSQYWPEKDADGRTAASLEIIDTCLAIKDALEPLAWWSLENPVGRLPKLRPETLGNPSLYFDPCDYGDPYTKKTGLWGNFTPPLPLFVGADRSVEPVRACSQGSWIQTLGGKSERTKELRSVTPSGFAQAFFECNP